MLEYVPAVHRMPREWETAWWLCTHHTSPRLWLRRCHGQQCVSVNNTHSPASSCVLQEL